jgi:SAM-dependent methyltransferase
MTPAITDDVRTYYDAHVNGKLRGFIEGNARVEHAWASIEQWAGEAPERILEVGCGIGDLSWRMSRRWTGSHVVGLDVSHRSLRVARKLFRDPRITFCDGPLAKGQLDGSFDLIVLIDVYEHIAQADRRSLHEAIAELLAPQGRIVLAFPTPRHLAWLKIHKPQEIQPVDEDITVETMLHLARETGTEVLSYQEIGVWHHGDYAHAVLGSWVGWKDQPQPTQDPRRLPPPALVPSRAARFKRVTERLGADAYRG